MLRSEGVPTLIHRKSGPPLDHLDKSTILKRWTTLGPPTWTTSKSLKNQRFGSLPPGMQPPVTPSLSRPLSRGAEESGSRKGLQGGQRFLEREKEREVVVMRKGGKSVGIEWRSWSADEPR